MKAKEPIATYYTPSMVNALQRSIVNRVSQETNPEKLTAISRILDDSPAKESFEERYQRAKVFAYKNFDKDYVQSLEAFWWMNRSLLKFAKQKKIWNVSLLNRRQVENVHKKRLIECLRDGKVSY